MILVSFRSTGHKLQQVLKRTCQKPSDHIKRAAVLKGCQPLQLSLAKLSCLWAGGICSGFVDPSLILPGFSHKFTIHNQHRDFPARSCSAEPSTRGQLGKEMYWACLAQDETAANSMLIIMLVTSSLTRCNPLQPLPMALCLGNASHNKSKGSALSQLPQDPFSDVIWARHSTISYLCSWISKRLSFKNPIMPLNDVFAISLSLSSINCRSGTLRAV